MVLFPSTTSNYSYKTKLTAERITHEKESIILWDNQNILAIYPARFTLIELVK